MLNFEYYHVVKVWLDSRKPGFQIQASTATLWEEFHAATKRQYIGKLSWEDFQAALDSVQH